MPTTDTHKICARCYKVKPRDEFRDRKDRNDGKRGYCITCQYKKKKDIENIIANRVRTHNHCQQCKKIKPIDDFSVNNLRKRTGRHHVCKKCMNDYGKSRRNFIKNFRDIPKNKTCKTCQINKPANEFNINNDSIDRLDYNCQICVNDYGKSRRRYYQRFMDIPETKTCLKCKTTKPSYDFHANNSVADRLYRICKKCANPIKNEWKRKWKRNPPTKVCRLCETTKPRIKFPKNVHSKDGRWHICMQCFDEYSIEYGDVDALIDKIQEKRENEIHKTCTKCGVSKPLYDFYHKRNTCKKCKNKQTQKAYHTAKKRKA